MLIEELTPLGLTREEAKVYLALLELGSGYVSAIAKKARVHRVGCYHTLNNLVEKGLISKVMKNKMQSYAVENPRILVSQTEERFHQAQELLPQLLSMTNSLAYKPKIQYYEGEEGIKNIFEDTLEAKEELLGYTNFAELPKVLPESYIKEYAQKKVSRKLKTRMLSPLSPEALKYTKTFYPKGYDERLVEILFINPKAFLFEYEINIYDDRVSLVSLNPKEVMGLIIQSPVYAKTQRAIFNLAWLGATSFVARY